MTARLDELSRMISESVEQVRKRDEKGIISVSILGCVYIYRWKHWEMKAT